MGIADHGGLGDRFMRHQRGLDLGGAHAVARDVEHIIDAPGDPVITILVATTAVTGEIHARIGGEVGLHVAFVIAPDRTCLPRPAVENHQVAFGRALEDVALVVDQRRLHTEERQRGGTRLEIGRARQRRDHDAAGLGLPPGVHQRAIAIADHAVEPLPGLGVDRLAHRAEQPQARARA